MEMGIARSSKEIGSRPADKSERTFIRFRCIFFCKRCSLIMVSCFSLCGCAPLRPNNELRLAGETGET